jgi:hypothetical protein
MWFFARTFPLWQMLGFHVTPNHFYQPIPDTRTLGTALWEKQSELAGVGLNVHGQLELLSGFETDFRSECSGLPREKTAARHQYYLGNPQFNFVDGYVWYCMIRRFMPRRIVEVGSGYSTCLAAQALMANGERGYPGCELTAIEPYPNRTLVDGFPGLSRLIQKRVQDVPLSVFLELRENDVLFVDSSHVMKTGSDVQYIILEVLPSIRRGVIVHFHDVFWPLEYPKKWVLSMLRFWNEQYALQAFMAFNRDFEVLWASSFMQSRYPEKLRAAFGPYDGERFHPCSLYIRRTTGIVSAAG